MRIPPENQGHEAFKPVVGHGGVIELPLLKVHDSSFERYAREGCLFEVLAAQIDKEEPEAAAIISAAANVKNALALIPHEMEAIRLTSRYCSKSAQVAGDVAFTTLRDQVAQSMASVAYDPDFFHIFKFVVECGAEDSPHIEFLCDFISKFVDPAKRRLRLSAFSVVTELPEDAAHMKIAIMVQAYCRPPKFGYCDSPERPLWKTICAKHKQVFSAAQRLLFFFFVRRQAQ